jgi:hypothetical protein
MEAHQWQLLAFVLVYMQRFVQLSSQAEQNYLATLIMVLYTNDNQ